MNKLALTYRVSVAQPSNLPFPNHMHCLVAFDRPPCAIWRPEAKARVDALFDEAVVLLNDVVLDRVKGGTDTPIEIARIL